MSDQKQLTYGDEIDALAELVNAIFKKWAEGNSVSYLETPVGTIGCYWAGRESIIEFGYPSQFTLRYVGEYSNGKKNPHLWEIDKGGFEYIESAKQMCLAVAQYYAAEDFQKKTTGQHCFNETCCSCH